MLGLLPGAGATKSQNTLVKVGAAAIEALVRLVASFPEAPLNVERRESSVVLTPRGPDTFEVTLYDQGDEAMIAAERWHSHYDDALQAAYGAYWLLSPFYRLVEELKGGVLVATWTERYEENGWEPMEAVYFLNPSAPELWTCAPGETLVWRYRQQNILPPFRPYQLLCPGAVLTPEGLPFGSRIGTTSVEASKAHVLTLGD